MSLPVPLLRGGYQRVLRPVLFASHHGDPEAIHEQLIGILASASRSPAALALLRLLASGPGRAIEVAGVRFPSRVGLAAGMDKDGAAVRAWGALGFGFAELGTVTAHAQPGNDRPRIFRLADSGALINRMGFNNAGATALAGSLAAQGIWRGNAAAGGPVGISIGKSRTVPVDDAVEDYLVSLRLVAPHADYVAINVSSPNTPNLRTLQDGGALATLTAALVGESRTLAEGTGAAPVPIFVKVAPDLSRPQLDEVLSSCESAGIAGMIATNTTLSRHGVRPADAALATEAGGLSGRPLTERAREVVGYLAGHTRLPVIGVGGVMTAEDAMALFDAGARLVQLYTGFIYGGPALAREINARDLRRRDL